MTLTDAVNVFLRQSLDTKGLPFLLSPENAEYMKAKVMNKVRLTPEAVRDLSNIQKYISK